MPKFDGHNRAGEARGHGGGVTAGVEAMVARMLAGYVALSWLSEIDGVVLQVAGAPWWWNAVLLSALAISIGGLVIRAARQRPIRGFAAAHAGVILVAVAIEIWLGPPRADHAPWLWAATGVAIVCAAVAGGLRWAIGYGLALAVTWALLRASPSGGAMGTRLATCDGIFLFVGGVGVAAVAVGMIRAARQADALAAAVIRRETAASVGAAVTAERDRLDRIVHDDVLTALAVAANADDDDDAATTSSVRALAAATLRRIDTMATTTIPDGEIAGGLWLQLAEETARNVTPRVDFHSEMSPSSESATLPAAVVEALVAAMREALRNAIAHADASRITATCTLEGSAELIAAHVVVCDDGIGFEPSQVEPDRLGMRASMLSRMTSIGGDCAISRGENGGTRVELAWRGTARYAAAADLDDQGIPAAELPAAFPSGLMIGAMWLTFAACLGLGIANADDVARPVPWALGVLPAAAMTYLVLHPGGGLRLPVRYANLCVLALALTQFLTIPSLPRDHSIGWSCWCGYPTTLTLAALVVRGRKWHALAALAVLSGAYVWWVRAAGADPRTSLPGLLFGPVIYTVIAALVVRTLKRISVHEAAFRARDRRTVDEAARRYVSFVQRALWAADVRTVAGPSLERIADGDGPLSDDVKDQARRAERALRESLVARHMMSDELVSITDSARRRGIDLDFVDSRHARLPPEVTRTITHGLRTAVESSSVSRIVVRLAPPGSPESATIVNDDGDMLLVMTVNPDGSSSVADMGGAAPPTRDTPS